MSKNMRLLLICAAIALGGLSRTSRADEMLFDSKKPFELVKTYRNGKTVYDIKCRFRNNLSDADKSRVSDSSHWKVTGTKDDYEVFGVGLGFKDDTTCLLKGNWPAYDELSVRYDSGAVYAVRKPGDIGNWRFGAGAPPDISVRRLADTRSLYAIDYAFAIQPVQLATAGAGKHLWIRNLGVSFSSNGTVGNSDVVRNGTQSALDIKANPFYCVAGLMYTGNLSFGYLLETRASPGGAGFLTVANKSAKLSLTCEVPLTNYPIYRLHTATNYARLAMPLTLSLGVLPKGKDGDGLTTSGRREFKAIYELALSPYLIIQGQYHDYHFNTPDIGALHSASYSSLAIAQDLDVVKKTLGFLKVLLGGDEELQNKNFIYFKISYGRDAPEFQSVHEKSIGLGTHF